MDSINLERFPLAHRSRFSLVLLLILISFTISSVDSAKTRREKQISNNLWWGNSIAKVLDKPKTFISDVIGLSALKFVFMMAVPFIFSVFLGAMLVMLFPFPLLTSTSGLAGAAAIGRRSDSSSSDDDLLSLLSYLGLGTPSSPELNVQPQPQPSQPHETFMQPVLLSSPSPEFPKINKRQLKLQQKFPVYHKAPRFVQVTTQSQPKSSAVNEDEECYEKIACEIGKSGGRNLRGVVNEIISSLSPQEKHEWYSAIQAYFKGSQMSSGNFGIIRNNVSIPYTHHIPSFINTNGIISNPYQAAINSQSCSSYKCTW